MKLKDSLIFLVAFFLLGLGISFSQGDRCSTIQPFCAGNARLVFPNSNFENSSQTNAETGPFYGCLRRQPYPAWFFLKIGEPGRLDFQISQNVNADGSGPTLDVDFIAWGPFSESDEFCSSALTSANVVSCSYSDSPVENFSIGNAVEGQIYVVLITNYDESPGFITLQQTNSSGGSTDCTIVGSSLGPDQKVCGQTEVVLDATNNSATEYLWYVYNVNTSSYSLIPGETGPTLTVQETGNYQVTVKSDILEDEASDQVLIEFFDIPIATKPSPVTGCDAGEGAVYNLTTAQPELIGNNTGSYSFNYYLSEQDFQNQIPITNPETFQGEMQFVYGSIVSNKSTCESLPVEIALKVAQAPEVDWNEETIICLDLNGSFISPVSIGKDLGQRYTYQWSIPNDPDGDGVQNPILNLNQLPPERTIDLTVFDSETGCSSIFSTELKVFTALRQVLIEIEGSDFERGGYQVTATAVGGIGDDARYEYRLDNGDWQEGPVFNGVPGGTHRISAREINGCGSTTSLPFRLIGYPRYFTPNNDGFNDVWNVINDTDVSIRKVLIFDRFGKLLKQIDPRSGGWDGTFNGQVLPANDYWFLIEFMDKETGQVQEFRGNFTLKR
jgi:gliding motility-associated-like protein